MSELKPGMNPSSDREDHSAVSLVLDLFLPYRLNYLSNRISDSLSQIYRTEHGLTVSEWRAFALFGEYDKLTAKEISRMSKMDKTRVSRTIVELETKGLIEKQPHENDKRATYISLSQSGKDLINTLIPKALHWEDQLFEKIDSREYRELFRIITKLERRIAEIEGDA